MRLKTSGDQHDESFQRLAKESELLLRIELQLLRRELKNLNLSFVRDWKLITAREVFSKYLVRLPLHDITFGPLLPSDFEGIDDRMRTVLAHHKQGTDWRLIYSERTRARHKAYFRKLGIDLDCPNEQEPTISLIDVLSKKGAIAKTPPWLIKAGMAPRLKKRTTPA